MKASEYNKEACSYGGLHDWVKSVYFKGEEYCAKCMDYRPIEEGESNGKKSEP